MKVVKCEFNHYFDLEKNEKCPICFPENHSLNDRVIEEENTLPKKEREYYYDMLTGEKVYFDKKDKDAIDNSKTEDIVNDEIEIIDEQVNNSDIIQEEINDAKDNIKVVNFDPMTGEKINVEITNDNGIIQEEIKDTNDTLNALNFDPMSGEKITLDKQVEIANDNEKIQEETQDNLETIDLDSKKEEKVNNKIFGDDVEIIEEEFNNNEVSNTNNSSKKKLKIVNFDPITGERVNLDNQEVINNDSKSIQEETKDNLKVVNFDPMTGERIVKENNVQTNYPQGLLLVIEGNDKGKTFNINKGKNFIGRNNDSDITLNDNEVDYDKHGMIIYDDKLNQFIAMPGDSKGLYYVNDQLILSHVVLNDKDIITIGQSKLVFIKLVNNYVNW